MKITDEQIEREQVEQVFGLTGGELEDGPWKIGEKTIAPFWYEGAPEYARIPDDTARTAVHCALHGGSPERIEDEGGAWVRRAEYQSSGETECCHRSGAPEDAKVKREQCRRIEVSDNNWGLLQHSSPNPGERFECPFCEARLGEDHGVIYLGDGWVETVYAFERAAADDDSAARSAATAALAEWVDR